MLCDAPYSIATMYLPGALLVLLVPLVTALPSPFSATIPLPLLIWHGLGDNYAADGIKAVGELAQKIHPKTFVYPIRLDEDPAADRRASFFGNLTTQIDQVCTAISEHPVLSQSRRVDAVGFSQGGQFLRGLVERCDAVAVRSLVTFGSQHNGISDFQACASNDWLCKGAMGLLRSNTWSTFIQGRLVPAQYYRSTNQTTGLANDEYLQYSNFLADVNNEREVKNATYARRLAALENFVMYVFEDDKAVIPKESGWFAEVNRTDGAVTHLRNRTIYTEDWIGLKKLDQKEGLVFRSIKGEHMSLDDEVLGKAFKEFFGPEKRGERLVSESWEL